MKKTVLALIAATVLAAPFAAQAQDRGFDPHHRGPVVVEKKRVVVTKRWERGHRVSVQDRRRFSEVRDYRRYRLSSPPRGYHWVRADNQYLLIGVTSGLISSIITAR
ncbi:MAG: RcnB family protein [Neorhizobium sp.]|jgi:Ni/Co efflux regulator RcnB|nr:RcnB family protein [Neorhizobium sp.]